MLKLDKLELNGFKSFNSKTEFTVGSGITAIVGPNGCGKSNIADAINWVIGGQSTKSLRAESMGDVIFNGTDARKPTGMAEVTLHLKAPTPPPHAAAAAPEKGGAGENGSGNGNGHEAGASGEASRLPDTIQITRRLFRSGESEYLIDGKKGRLRDIQELLAEVHVGTGLYSIIEQGRIDSVLTSRPKDRRALIEEAAGIALYKVRKRQAQTKLEATEANLLRINDMVGELERQIGSLKRQAARARRYARLTESIDRGDRILVHAELQEINAAEASLSERHAALQKDEAAASAVLARAQADLSQAREQESVESAKHQEARDHLHNLDRAIDTLREKVDRWKEQEEEATTQIHKGNREIAGLEERIADSRTRIARLACVLQEMSRESSKVEASLRNEECGLRLDSSRLQALGSELDASREDMAAAAGDLSDSRGEIRRLEESLERAHAELAELDRTGAQIEADSADLASRHELQRSGLLETGEALSKVRSEASEAERLLAGETSRRESLLLEKQEKIGRLHALEERLSSLEAIDEDLDDLLAGVDGSGQVRLLKDLLSPPEHLDRAVDASLRSLLSGLVTPSRAAADRILEELKMKSRRALIIPGDMETGPVEAGAGGPASLATYLGAATSLPGLQSLFSRILVAEDLPAARQLRESHPGFDVVTLEGDLLSRDGWIEGGAPVPDEAGIMTLKRLIERLRADAGEARSRIDALESDVAASEEKIASLKSAQTGWKEAEAKLARETEALKLRTESLEEEVSRLGMRRKVQAGEQSRLREDRREFTEALARQRERHQAMLELTQQLQRRMESLTGDGDELRRSLRGRGEDLARLREAAAAARERRAAADSEHAHLGQLLEELGGRLAKEQFDLERWSSRKEEARTRQREDTSALSDQMAERILAEGRVASAEAILISRRQAISALEGAEKEARGALEAEREKLTEHALERERISGDRRNLEARVVEKGLPGIAEAIADLSEEEKSRDLDDVREELLELKRKRDSMGAVNLMAMEQFQELEERHTFVHGQRADLEGSIRSLQETIGKINRQSRERFLEAFEQIRCHFIELFKTLFGGGRSDLRLLHDAEGETDILEAGLEISAQPPGKKLQSISLLSGGEKALTAAALLFAIFKYQPSPFCLLDEVDAPLDEANVNRFVNLLKSLTHETQFIVVTHNRRTMEAADLLYGVTMEEPGISRAVSVVMGTEEGRRAARTLPEQMASRHRGTGPGAPGPAASHRRADA